MTATYGQYQPVSNVDTCVGAPLTVRAVRDIAEALNNGKRYALVDKVLSHVSPVGTQSADGYDDERVSLVFAPRFVPRGFTDLRVFGGHKRASGAGETTWRVYSMPSQYQGAGIFNVSMLPAGSRNCELTTTSDTYAIGTNLVEIARSKTDETWLMVTSDNSLDSSYSKLYTLDAWPVWGEETTPAEGTRLYLARTAAAVTPAANYGWTLPSAEYLGQLVAAHTDTALTAAGHTGLEEETDSYISCGRWVSPQLDGDQTISGTVTSQIAAYWNSAVTPVSYVRSAMEIYVVSGDGATVRGTLLSAGSYHPTDVAMAYARNKVFTSYDSLSSVAALNGDRLVVVTGVKTTILMGPDDVLPDAALYVVGGDPVGTDDYGRNETETGKVPWVAFSQTLSFSA